MTSNFPTNDGSDSRYASVSADPVSFESPPGSTTGSSADSSDLKQIGPYRFVRQIGRGGMGVVYEAQDLRLQRRVAVKMLLNPDTADSRGERFLREATSTARLTHPNIVQIHDVGRDNGRDFIVMMFVEGMPLSEALRCKVFSYEEIATVLEVVARAVHFAHSRGVIHRDLKPANIMLTGGAWKGSSLPGTIPEAVNVSKDFIPMVMDFGLAKDLALSRALSLSGQAMGTPSYMPPEQAVGKTDLIGPASDVYSLGATLYECLTGRAPFSGASPIEILDAVVHADPVSPRVISPRIPRDLETICLKCLEKDPARRYGSAEALAQDIHAWLAGDSIKARPRSIAYRVWRTCRRHPTTTVGVVLGTVGLMTAFALLLRNEHLKHEVFIDREKSQKAARDRSIQTAKSNFEEAKIILKFSGGLGQASEPDLRAALDFCDHALRDEPSFIEATELAAKISRAIYDRAIRAANWQTSRAAHATLSRYASAGEAMELLTVLKEAEDRHYSVLRERVWILFEDAKSPSRKYTQGEAVTELTSIRCDFVENELGLYLSRGSPKCTLLALEALAWQGSGRFNSSVLNWISPKLPGGESNPLEFQIAAIRTICRTDESSNPDLYKKVVQRIFSEPGRFESDFYRAISNYYVPYAEKRAKRFNIKADIPE